MRTVFFKDSDHIPKFLVRYMYKILLGLGLLVIVSIPAWNSFLSNPLESVDPFTIGLQAFLSLIFFWYAAKSWSNCRFVVTKISSDDKVIEIKYLDGNQAKSISGKVGELTFEKDFQANPYKYVTGLNVVKDGKVIAYFPKAPWFKRSALNEIMNWQVMSQTGNV